jgi:ParB-like chromosome segregation protein Spo0J
VIQSGTVSYHQDLEPLLTDIDAVRPHPENYSNGDVELIMESIMVSGMYRPIYVQKSSGFIVAGNHTWLACKELGAEKIPVVVLDVDDITAERLMVADNEIARKARPDTGQLVKLLEDLQQHDSLMGTGITDRELEQLKALADMPLELPDDATRKMWPTVCFQIPPHVKRAFYDMTEVAGGDRERFELMLRLAGWDGRAQQ